MKIGSIDFVSGTLYFKYNQQFGQFICSDNFKTIIKLKIHIKRQIPITMKL